MNFNEFHASLLFLANTCPFHVQSNRVTEETNLLGGWVFIHWHFARPRSVWINLKRKPVAALRGNNGYKANRFLEAGQVKIWILIVCFIFRFLFRIAWLTGQSNGYLLLPCWDVAYNRLVHTMLLILWDMWCRCFNTSRLGSKIQILRLPRVALKLTHSSKGMWHFNGFACRRLGVFEPGIDVCVLEDSSTLWLLFQPKCWIFCFGGIMSTSSWSEHNMQIYRAYNIHTAFMLFMFSLFRKLQYINFICLRLGIYYIFFATLKVKYYVLCVSYFRYCIFRLFV